MLKKIKNVLIIIGSALLVFILTVYCVLMCGGKANRRRSERDNERDSAIQGGIGETEERAERIEEGISRAEEGISSCEEHLLRAEEILRNAIKRSRGEGAES